MNDDELAALVAEKIMGWERAGEGDYVRPLHHESGNPALDDWDSKGPHDYLFRRGERGSKEKHYFCSCRDDGYSNHHELPCWRYDLEDAWEVVERMTTHNTCPCGCGEHFRFELEVTPKRNGDADNNNVSAAFWARHSDKRWAEAGDVPEAICLAALKALGVNVTP